MSSKAVTVSRQKVTQMPLFSNWTLSVCLKILDLPEDIIYISDHDLLLHHPNHLFSPWWNLTKCDKIQTKANDSTDVSWWSPKWSIGNWNKDLCVKLFIAAQGPKQVHLIAGTWELHIIFDLEKNYFVENRENRWLSLNTNRPISSQSTCMPASQEKHSK